MMIICALALGLAAFAVGFLLGLMKNSATLHFKTQRIFKDSEELQKIKQEYSNFLNYDGTEQP